MLTEKKSLEEIIRILEMVTVTGKSESMTSKNQQGHVNTLYGIETHTSYRCVTERWLERYMHGIRVAVSK